MIAVASRLLAGVVLALYIWQCLHEWPTATPPARREMGEQ
jgi:hypothetical protein